MTRALPLLVLVLAVAAIGWFLLGGEPADEDTAPIDASASGRGEGAGPDPVGPSGTSTLRSEPGPGGIPRVGVLGPGEEPPFLREHPPAPDTQVRLRAGTSGEPPSGGDVLEAVSRIAYLRAHRAEDLEGLDEVPVPPDWTDRIVRLEDVVEHWRRHGYDLVPAGRTFLVHRRPVEKDPDSE